MWRAALYLIFFWTWGLNYHRQPLASKLQVDSASNAARGHEQMFARHAGGSDQSAVRRETEVRYDENADVRRSRPACAESGGNHRWFDRNPRIGQNLVISNPAGCMPPASKCVQSDLVHRAHHQQHLLDIERPLVIAMNWLTSVVTRRKATRNVIATVRNADVRRSCLPVQRLAQLVALPSHARTGKTSRSRSAPATFSAYSNARAS